MIICRFLRIRDNSTRKKTCFLLFRRLTILLKHQSQLVSLALSPSKKTSLTHQNLIVCFFFLLLFRSKFAKSEVVMMMTVIGRDSSDIFVVNQMKSFISWRENVIFSTMKVTLPRVLLLITNLVSLPISEWKERF